MEHLDPLTSIILPYVNFVIFAVMAVIFFRKPIAKMVQGKRQSYEAMVRESQKLRDEAKQAFNAVKAKSDALDTEFAKLRADMLAQAKTEALQAIESAKKLSEHIEGEARRISDFEIQRAKTELQQELVQTALTMAQNEITEKLTSDEHTGFVERRIAELKSIRIDG